MKKLNTAQEILLLTNSSLARQELAGNDAALNNKDAGTWAGKLEEACWNGLLNEWLPQVILKNDDETPLFLWKINLGKAFLCIEMSEAPVGADYHCSLDPYLFLPSLNMN